MADQVIHVRGTVADVLAVMGTIPQIAAGQGDLPLARALLIRMGIAALYRISRAFIVKAAGGTDETGLKWKPLSPSTIAYHRRQLPKPGAKNPIPKGRGRAAKAPSYALTPKQRENWWRYYRSYLGRYNDKAHAARAAWVRVKAEGGTTLMARYGSQPVQILRDTGLLLTSLTPGTYAGGASPPKVKKQVFDLARGTVIIGTNREWAWTHHKGTARIPRRELWPDPSRWPESWWDEITSAGVDGLIDIILYLLRSIP